MVRKHATIKTIALEVRQLSKAGKNRRCFLCTRLFCPICLLRLLRCKLIGWLQHPMRKLRGGAGKSTHLSIQTVISRFLKRQSRILQYRFMQWTFVYVVAKAEPWIFCCRAILDFLKACDCVLLQQRGRQECAFVLWKSRHIKLEPKKMLMECFYARNISWVPQIVHTLQNT